MKKVLVLLVLVLVGSTLATTDSGNEGSSVIRSMVLRTDAKGDYSLTTQFASNNNYAGNSFDLIAANDITVVGWDINVGPDLPDYDINVYWKNGTAYGFEQNIAVWNLLGSNRKLDLTPSMNCSVAMLNDPRFQLFSLIMMPGCRILKRNPPVKQR